MTPRKQTFTYRQGKKLPLETQPDEIVVRALPHEVRDMGLELGELEQVSSQSTRVHVEPAALERTLENLRKVAPTHRSYRRADTGDEFLITDRVFVIFANPPTEEELGEFA